MAAAEPKEEFLGYIENHPEYYPVLQSRLFIAILEILAKAAKSPSDLVAMFPQIDAADSEAVIDALFRLKLVSRIKSHNTIFYYTNDNGRELLEKFRKAAKYFRIA